MYHNTLTHLPESLDELFDLSPMIPSLLFHRKNWSNYWDEDTYFEKLEDFARTGMLNAAPFAYRDQEFLVFKLAPSQKGPLEVGFTEVRCSDGITLTHQGKYWALSLCCYHYLAESLKYQSMEEIMELGMKSLKDLGEETVVRTFIQTWQSILEAEALVPVKSGLMWMELFKLTGHTYFNVLGIIWTHKAKDLLGRNDLPDLAEQWPQLVKRKLMHYHVMAGNPDGFSKDIPWLVQQSDVFDAVYGSKLEGGHTGTFMARVPSVASYYYLKYNLKLPDEIKEFEPAWLALGEKRKEYDGKEHFELANQFAERDPPLAFRMVCNASTYYSGKHHELNLDYFDFARKLAEENGWVSLMNFYGWMAQVV